MGKPIFISYKRVDRDRVFEIKSLIEAQTGIACWIDLDGIESDAQFANVIIKAINESMLFLFMYSERHSQIIDYENDWTIRELSFAQSKNKRIVFINTDNSQLTDWFQLIFGTKQQIDATDNDRLLKLCYDISCWFQKEERIAEDEVTCDMMLDSHMIIDINHIVREYFDSNHSQIVKKTHKFSWKDLFKRNTIFLDIGSYTTKILFEGKVIYNDFSFVMFENRTFRCTSIGKDAFKQLDRAFRDVSCVCPVKDGVFSDYDAGMIMLNTVIRNTFKRLPFNIDSPEVVWTLPVGITEVEKCAVKSIIESSGLKKIWTIEDSICIAASFGLNIKNHEACLIADIGYSKAVVSVIYDGAVLHSKHILGAGKRITKSIKDYLKIKHELVMSESFSELIKTVLFNNLVADSSSSNYYRFTGVDLKTDNVKSVNVPQRQIIQYVKETCLFIQNTIGEVIVQTPDELRSYVVENGIYLSGGSALLEGLREMIQDNLNLPCHVSSHPQFDILIGAEKLYRDINNRSLFNKT